MIQETFVAEVLGEAIFGAISGIAALGGSGIVQIRVRDVLPREARGTIGAIAGTTVKIPYTDALPELSEYQDGDEIPVVTRLAQAEEAQVRRFGLAVRATRLVEDTAVDSWVEQTSQQLADRARRAWERASIAELNTTPLEVTSPTNLNLTLLAEALSLFGDAVTDIAGIVVSSKTMQTLRALTTSGGTPLLIDPKTGPTTLPTFGGVPVVTTDMAYIENPVASLVTQTGSSPAFASLSVAGVQHPCHVHVVCTQGGTLATAQVQYYWNRSEFPVLKQPSSISAPLALLTDGQQPSGITITFDTGSYTAGDTWTFSVDGDHVSLLCKRNSVVVDVNYDPEGVVEFERLPRRDATDWALNLYFACHRYRRLPPSNRTGVVRIVHPSVMP